MTMPSSAYWQQRSAARMDKYLRDSDQTLRIIREAHAKAKADIEDAISRIRRRMGKAYGLDPSEVSRLLAEPVDRAEYDNLLQTIAGVKDPAVKRTLMARASSGAYAFRLNRLEALKNNVRAQMAKLADVELNAATKSFSKTVKGAYQLSIFDLQRGTGHGFAFDQLHDKAIAEILHNPWSGKSFSSRIWSSSSQIAEAINRDITAGFASGRSTPQMSRDLADKIGVSYYNAERLVRTETNYMAGQAELKSYEEAGIEEYEYMATLDMLTSEVCQDLDGQVFAVKDAKPGVNMNPMHPHCRSTTVASLTPRNEANLQRRAKDPITGKSVLVPRDMTYKDWQKLQADTYGPERVALAGKMQANVAKDRKQFVQYSAVLGKTPFTADFKAFQQMKYTNSEAYSFVKLDYARRSRLASNPSLILPNAEKSTAANEKFTKYFFDPSSKKGWPKGVAFDSRLGYNKGNWTALQNELCSKASSYPATRIEQTPFGAKYEQKIVLYGLKGKPANVVIGWMQDGEKTWLTTAMIKEVD